MRQVYQTLTEPPHGNCFAAALASLLDTSLDEVPNFHALTLAHGVDDSSVNFYVRVQEFLACRGLTMFEYSTREQEPALDSVPYVKFGMSWEQIADVVKGRSAGGYYIAGVPSKRINDALHAIVIDTEFKPVHDPNADNVGKPPYTSADLVSCIVVEPALNIAAPVLADDVVDFTKLHELSNKELVKLANEEHVKLVRTTALRNRSKYTDYEQHEQKKHEAELRRKRWRELKRELATRSPQYIRTEPKIL